MSGIPPYRPLLAASILVTTLISFLHASLPNIRLSTADDPIQALGSMSLLPTIYHDQNANLVPFAWL